MNHPRPVPDPAKTVENRPVPLKPPVWTWEVPLYFFVGGVAGSAALIGAMAARAGGDATLARDAHLIAAIGALLSPLLLISDLGRPSRFLYMLRVFKPQSAMSVGAWTLVVFSGAAITSAVLDRFGGSSIPMGSVASAGADFVAAFSGLVLATYTGVLLGATAIPVWARHVRLLPLHFGASSLGATASMLELVGHRTVAMNAICIGAAAIETVVLAVLELRPHAASRPLVEGPSGLATRTSGVLTGPLPLVLRLVGAAVPPLRVVAAASAILGSCGSRFAWIAAGRISALGPRGLVVLAAIGATRGLVAVEPVAASGPSVATVVQAAVTYVADYQQQFAFLIADESSHQTTFDMHANVTSTRTTHGELFLTYLAVDKMWMAVHDVADVDGMPVADRDDLRAEIRRGALSPALRRIADRNARFNIGSVARNFNEPTFGLRVLEAARVKNFRFTLERVVPAPGEPALAFIAFTERGRPTLVRGPVDSIPASGELVVEVLTGRVHRTRMTWQDAALTADLVTDYSLEPKLALWVPTTFAERYAMGGPKLPLEETRCVSTYTTYRRFETGGRIK